MIIDFSADIIEDSGLHPLISNLNLLKFFKEKDYGNNEVKLFFVINCIGENTKLRKSYRKKEQTLYWDVILSYNEVKKLTFEEKKALLAEAILTSFDILDKYKKLKIDKIALKKDLQTCFRLIGWLKEDSLLKNISLN